MKKALHKRIASFLVAFCLVAADIFVGAGTTAAAAGSRYETELAKFPASFQSKLKVLHTAHPNWIFVASDTGLQWNASVTAESKSGTSLNDNLSLTQNTFSDFLKSNRPSDYDPATGSYIPKDGSSWVSCNEATVAYYLDARNFLTEDYIFMFEGLSFQSAFHTLEGVEAILSGTDIASKKITYTTTSGAKKTLNLTYGQAIYNAGKQYGVSPYFLAAKIRQETSGSLSNSSICGNYSYGGKSYRGYYNFYNIGAYASTTSPVANGLEYASSGTSYSRPWTDPEKAIKGGAEFIGSSYISNGQDTIYYQRFNVGPDRQSTTYYHQYMSNISGAATEGEMTYDAYRDLGIEDNAYVFYIPVFRAMPTYDATISFDKTTADAKTLTAVTLRSKPTRSSDAVANVPSGATVKLSGCSFTTASAVYPDRLNYPYWMKVSYGIYNGYICANYLLPAVSTSVVLGKTYATKVTCSDTNDAVYYQTNNPAVATVDKNGVITGVGKGECAVFAFTSSGRKLDMMGISVNISSTPKLLKAVNTKTGIALSWAEAYRAAGYYVYRKVPDGSWARIATLAGATNLSYQDNNTVCGTQYIYTVRSYDASGVKSSYDAKGIACTALSAPELRSAVFSLLNENVTVKWNAVPGAKGYYLYRRVFGATWSRIKIIENGETQSYIDTGVTLNQKYDYTVRAYAGSSLSLFEPGVSTDTTVNYCYYQTTADVSYRTGPGTSYSAVGTIKKGKAVPVVIGCAKRADGLTWYKINIDGKHYFVAAKYLTIVKDAGIPALVSAVNIASGVRVTWKAASYAHGYTVYRKQVGGSWVKLTNVKSANARYYDDTTAQSGVNYCYTVRAYNIVGVRGKYDAAGVTVLYLATPKPTSGYYLTAENAIHFDWKPVSGAKGYILYRKTSASASWTRLTVLNSGSASGYTDEKVSAGKNYYYTLKAFSGKTASSYVKAGKFISSKSSAVSTPVLKSAANTTDGIKLTWSLCNCAGGYRIYRKNAGDTQWKTLANVTSQRTLTFVDKKVAEGTEYIYTVRALHPDGTKSGYNKTGIGCLRLASPVLQSAVYSPDITAVTLKWKPVTGAKGYWIYRKTTGGWSRIAQVGKVRSYTDTDLSNNTTYCYTVRAFCEKYGSWYDAAGVTVKVPELLVYYVTNDTVNYRSGPGTAYAVKGTFPIGTSVSVVKGIATEANGYTWYKIKLESGYAYIASAYLTAM